MNTTQYTVDSKRLRDIDSKKTDSSYLDTAVVNNMQYKVASWLILCMSTNDGVHPLGLAGALSVIGRPTVAGFNPQLSMIQPTRPGASESRSGGIITMLSRSSSRSTLYTDWSSSVAL